jgi:aryl-alcohol dehydrogenase-like predicted oxidoreductase
VPSLFSKGRSQVEDGPNGGGASRIHLHAQPEASLKRLKTDWLDLYFVHQWDGATPIEETVEKPLASRSKGNTPPILTSRSSRGTPCRKSLTICSAPKSLPPS